jgi:hypothetical protein
MWGEEMNRRLAAFGAVTAGLLLAVTAAPSWAAGSADEADDCTPGIKVLESLPGPWEHPEMWVENAIAANGVMDFGRGGLAVGASHKVPVYWTGTALHRVPLPDGYSHGIVNAVNRDGLMVGSLDRDATRPGVAFSYRQGDQAVKILPEGGVAVDVNDSGHIVGTGSY